MNPTDDKNTPVEKRVNTALDKSIDDLHPDIRRKLNQARVKALQSKSSPSLFNQPVWKVAGAVSFVALVTFISLESTNDQLNPTEIAANLETIDHQELKTIKMEQTSLEIGDLEEVAFIEELEFALWMAEENQIASL